MPITVRYGPGGQLLQAAEQVGEGQARQRQKQIDLQRIGQVRDYYAQQDQARQDAYEAQLEQERARMQAELERAKMQQQSRARQAARARQAPTTGPQQRQDTPLAREAQDAAERFQAQYNQPETAETGYGAVRGPGGEVAATSEGGIVTGPGGEEVRRRGGERAQQAVEGLGQQQGGGLVTGQGEQPQQAQQTDNLMQAKQSLARMMGAGQLPEEQLKGIQQAIANPAIGADEFGVRVNQALDQAGRGRGQADPTYPSGLSPEQAVGYEVEAIDQRIEQVMDQISQTENRMANAAYRSDNPDQYRKEQQTQLNSLRDQLATLQNRRRRMVFQGPQGQQGDDQETGGNQSGEQPRNVRDMSTEQLLQTLMQE